MPWETRTLEQRMYSALTATYGETRGEELKALYIAARRKLVDDVLPLVVVAEPTMTDHSAKHVANVLDNANRLIGPDAFEGTSPRFSGADAYTLCLAILFHDAGMVYQRPEHERNITLIYDHVRQDSMAPRQEKALVYRIASAHTGTTDNGSQDTIGGVPPTMDLEGERVNSRELAAILRIADELAEGPQRTSSFLQEHLVDTSSSSQLYHQYAEITSVAIDREFGRFALTYHFNLDADAPDPVPPDFRALLNLTFSRVVKLDRERRYARFYSRHLAPFNRTEVVLNVWSQRGLLLDLEPLILSDKNALDDTMTALSDIDDNYDAEAILANVQSALEG